MFEEKETVDGESKYYETCQEKELGKKLIETTLRGGKEEVTLIQIPFIYQKNIWILRITIM